jgi:phospholipase/carboxylesterase
MDVVRLGPLRVRRVVKGAEETAKGAAAWTVVLAHGFGAPGDDLVGLAGMIDAPPGTTFLFPEAPHALSDLLGGETSIYGGARAWWMIDVARLERATRLGELRDPSSEVPEGLAAARAAFIAMLDALAEQGTPASRTVIGGFSQGSMMATDVALRDARPLAGLVVLSGTLLAEKEWIPRMTSRAGLPVFQSHGTVDPILPYAIAERLRRELDGAGAAVTFRSFEGGHGIPPEVMRDLGLWLRGLV